MPLDIHNDPELFRASVRFSADQTGFTANLIEKDYLCSVLLDYLAHSSDGSLIFKGGTCLAKVHFDFNRLSEDLDFIIPMPIDAKRKERSTRANIYKKAVSNLPKAQPILQVRLPLEGQNESRQYLATVGYKSIFDGHEDTIKLEIGLREPLLTDPIDGPALTILRNAAKPDEKITPIPFPCLSFQEAMAEKFRAALSRRDVAIRDFYDIDHAVLHSGLETKSDDFLDLIRNKLAVPGNDPLDISNGRLSKLAGQLDARLKPVLREKDFKQFQLDRAIRTVMNAGERLRSDQKQGPRHSV